MSVLDQHKTGVTQHDVVTVQVDLMSKIDKCFLKTCIILKHI